MSYHLLQIVLLKIRNKQPYWDDGNGLRHYLMQNFKFLFNGNDTKKMLGSYQNGKKSLSEKLILLT